MIITIFFIVAGIAILIGAAIYSNKRKHKKVPKHMDKKNSKQMKKSLLRLWGIDRINNNVITANGATSIIIELRSIDYDFADNEEKNRIDTTLINIAKTLVYPIQFLSTKRKINIDRRIEEIKECSKDGNRKIREYANDVIEHLKSIKEEKELYIEKDYMIITSYEETKKAEKDLKYFYDNLKYNLMNIKVSTKLLNNLEIIELLQREFNKDEENLIEKIIEKGGLELYVVSEERKEN